MGGNRNEARRKIRSLKFRLIRLVFFYLYFVEIRFLMLTYRIYAPLINRISPRLSEKYFA